MGGGGRQGTPAVSFLRDKKTQAPANVFPLSYNDINLPGEPLCRSGKFPLSYDGVNFQRALKVITEFRGSHGK